MSLQAETKTKIGRETEEHSKMSLVPAEEVDVGVAVGLVDDLKQLCQDKANIVPAIDFQKLTVLFKYLNQSRYKITWSCHCSW